MKIVDDDLKYILEHVFLPPKLPQKHDSDAHRKELRLLDYVTKASKSFADILATSIDTQSSNELKVWTVIPKMLKIMGRLYADGGIVRDELEAALQRMNINDVLPMFVEAQNAGIIFRKIANDILTFEAFEVSLPSDVVIGTCGKISMSFPANPRLPFPAEKVVLSTLANVLAHLSTSFMEEAISFSKKGGEQHHEIRNTASPRFITEALAGIIRATPPTRHATIDTTYVQKRLDDQVLWKSALKPWRRSPMWLVIRVTMQTTLQQWGAGKTQDYKAFQAFLMASLLEEAISRDPERFTCDLLDSMRAKVVKRLCKLGETVKDFTFPTLQTAADAVRHTSKIIEQRAAEVRSLHESTVQWTASREKSLCSKTALEFAFPKSRDFLLGLIKRHDFPAEGTSNFDRGVFEATLSGALPSPVMLSPSHIPEIAGDGSSLDNFELWVEMHLKQWEQSPCRAETDSLTLSSAIDRYREKAAAHYKGSPERISLMHLCILELWAALDRICTKWCPLLQEYSPEIAQNVADPLVLPYFSQMQRLERFQTYLGHRHRDAQKQGSLSVIRQVNAKQSFHNQYFNWPIAAPLLGLEKKIHADAASRKAETISQLQNANAKYKTLMRQAEVQNCVSVQVDSPDGGRRWRHKKKRCPKCQLIKTANGLRVVPFEDHLPEDVLMARPIIFELRCPMPFAIWRDATMMVIISILGVGPKPQPDLYPLRSYAPLNEYFCNPYEGCRINLASTAKSLKQSHYGNPCPVPATESSVLFGHKGRFTVFDVTANEWIDPGFEGNLRSTCSFSVDGLYEPLQRFVNDTRHAPNSVVATVSNVPLGLSTTEYINFGLLRSGNRIQWRNVMRTIKSQNLSFSEPAVFALIAQSIWQAGPIGCGSGSEVLYREAHIDLLDENFGIQVAEELLRTVQSLGDNWKQANFLAILVVLALRAQAFTPHSSVHGRIQRVLSEVRNVSMRWIKTLSNSQSGTSEPDYKHGSKELKDHNAQAMANVAVVLRASFDVECNGYSGVFGSSKDAVTYIYAAILISAVHTRTFSPSLKLLASRNHRLSLRVEPHLIRACLDNPSILQDVVGLAWPRYSTGSQWSVVASCRDRWWASVQLGADLSISQTFHMNIVDGAFLIDGKAFHQLPADYGSNPIYMAIFKDHVFRTVRPSTIAGMQYQSHYGIYEVHFGMIDSRLIVLRREGTSLQEYIPAESIQHDLPSIFSTDHCFWYSINRHAISIQPLSHAWASDTEKHWIIDLESYSHRFVGRVEKKRPSGVESLVDSRSEIHCSLVQTLAPLEPDPRGIVVAMLNGDTAAISAHLPRHDLSFAIHQNELQCLSVPEYVVDVDLAGIGCLVGLKSILNLRHSDLRQPRRKVIVPKGSITLAPSQYGHVNILIDIGDSRGYFIYDVDDLVGRLVGTRTMESDLYLAKLHAFTASCQPDLLTQRTGTEEALDRLASAASFSFYTVSKEARSYLDDIATLTPLRSFYPVHLRVMETVKWTKHLPTSAQRPEFRSKAGDILQSWRGMEAFIHVGELAKDLESVLGMEHLTYRAAHRDWIHSCSIVPKGSAVDRIYTGRDCLTDSKSRARENATFQAASLSSDALAGVLGCQNLQDVVLTWKSVTGVQSWGWDSIENWLSSPVATPIADTWCTFYELCRHIQLPRFDVSAALAFQRFRGVPLGLIGALRAVINNRQFSSSAFKLPQWPTFELVNGSSFNRETILCLVKTGEQSFKQSDEYRAASLPTENDASWEDRVRKLYRNALVKECNHLMDEFNECWPAPPSRPLKTRLRLLKPSAAIIEDNIRPLLGSWSQNREFLSCIQRVQSQLNKMTGSKPFSSGYNPYHPPSIIRPPRSFKMTLESLIEERTPDLVYAFTMEQLPMPPNLISNHEEVDVLLPLLKRLQARAQNVLQKDYVNNLGASLKEYKNYLVKTASDCPDRFDENLFESFRSISIEHHLLYLKQVRRCLRPDTAASQLMQVAGIWPTVTTQALLQCLSLKGRRNLSPPWSRLLTFHAMSIHEVKRISRMLRLARAGMKNLLGSEIQYTRAWDPAEHPDWLLVEIEADLSVRAVQAAVAKEMLQPESGHNSVMQLNMGEGKSSVIVPIAAASASTGSNLCRVVVLGPQMKQQFQILRQTLTGLCNRRIIYLPFNRKVHLDATAITQIQNFLREGLTDGAIWICEPEHLMSLKLLALDQLVHTGVRHLVDLYFWLHENSKDILDESDEILHARQQVIYTVGSQKSLDAAPARWEVVQKVLGLLATYLMQDPHGQESSFLVRAPPDIAAFPVIRVQSDAAREHLLRFMENSLQNHDWPLPPHMNDLVTKFVTMSNPLEGVVSSIQDYCSNEDRRVMRTILILRGLIARDILMHSLKDKRWRVQYGLDLQRSKLAVPFRAKDSPSPRSEFGHPDVTILLTCLSYYYAGLDLEMVRHTLQSLLSSETPDLTYADWLNPCWESVPIGLRTVKGLNLQDEHLLHTQIYPLLRYNKAVIDFYLNVFIFPTHAQEFPFKMSTSGWDIAIPKPNLTTGFSGTNDGRLLLPVTITQTDQDAQLHTNAKVLSYILKKENLRVVPYPTFLGSIELLDTIRKLSPEPPTVILDVGAQILDLSNIEFAKCWLATYRDDPVIKAAVFFDEWNNLLVLTPDGVTQPFIGSPYSSRLKECLVYLDDSHTRGTDLRIPLNTRAAVTLGPKLTKDKLVQGCMRMRKLGEGHSLVFMASDEVVSLISNATGSHKDDLTTEDVILWSIQETWQQLQANLSAWVLQGHSFVRREDAWQDLSSGNLLSSKDVSDKFCETEARTLEELYGSQSAETAHWVWRYHSVDSKNETARKIARRCQDFTSFTITDAGTHEEVEIELVHEKEVEREVERAPDAEPAQHELHANVALFVATGSTSLCYGEGFRRAAAAFFDTSFVVPKGFNEVFRSIVVTEDFCRTIKLASGRSGGSMDNFMRSVDWVVTTASPQTNLMVLLSPYEVNQLLPKFRTSKRVKLHMFSLHSNLAVPSLEDLTFLSLPSDCSTFSLPRTLVLQLNLFSGSLYFRDYRTYQDVCRILHLHFGDLPEHLRKPSVINANFFVLDPKARVELGMGELGFKENALPFFENMIRMRRFGRGFGPSHMGKILHGNRLKESDFVGGVLGDQDDVDMVEA